MIKKLRRNYFTLAVALLCDLLPLVCCGSTGESAWKLGPFERAETNPILTHSPDPIFYCPIQHKEIHWEAENFFNPGAVVRNGKVYIFYRAEDNYGSGIGYHTSRLGVAKSRDGIHFHRIGTPVLFPDHDDQNKYEFPGGCEDPRIVENEEGKYVMTYTQWNREMAVLGIATSSDLLHWKKYGYAFEGHLQRQWSKSGSIVCRRVGDRLIATKIQDKYLMYWGEGHIHAAVSKDLISWEPLRNKDGTLLDVLGPRAGKFDSMLVEAGPPAIITEKGILLLYNGKNCPEKGDPQVTPKAYSAGQVLFDLSNPTQIISRSENYFLTPEKSYEMKGQYEGGTVFIQGLVHFKNKWLLYYGCADSAIGVAVSK